MVLRNFSTGRRDSSLKKICTTCTMTQLCQAVNFCNCIKISTTTRSSRETTVRMPCERKSSSRRASGRTIFGPSTSADMTVPLKNTRHTRILCKANTLVYQPSNDHCLTLLQIKQAASQPKGCLTKGSFKLELNSLIDQRMETSIKSVTIQRLIIS